MMQILLIEDDVNKAAQLKIFFNENFSSLELEWHKSYQSGLKCLVENRFRLAILDMSLPTFDIKTGEDGYRFRKLGGLDILKELKRKKIETKVIVVTQFETFGEGKELIDLQSLKITLQKNFGTNYRGTVYYKADETKWKTTLEQLIVNLINEYGKDINS